MHITVQLTDGEIMVPSYQITLQKERVRTNPYSGIPLNTFAMGSTATAMPFSSSSIARAFTIGNGAPPESSSSEDDDDSSTDDEDTSTTDYPTMPTPVSTPTPSTLDRLTERLRRGMLAEERRNPTDPAEYFAETHRRARLENEMFDRNLGPTNPAGEVPLGPTERMGNYMTELGYPASYVAAMSATSGAQTIPQVFPTPEIPIESEPEPEPTWQYYMRLPKQSLLISREEYERVQGLLRQLNVQEIRDMEDKIKIEEVKKSWSGKNPALFGMDLNP